MARSNQVKGSGINLGPHRRRKYPAPDAAEAAGATERVVAGENPDGPVAVPEDAVTVDQVTDWVLDTDDDAVRRERAQAALDAEQSREGGPRSTLVSGMESLLADEGDDETS